MKCGSNEMVRKSCEEPHVGPPTLHLCPVTQELLLNSAWPGTCLTATDLSGSLDPCPTLLPSPDLLCCSCLSGGGLRSVWLRSLPAVLSPSMPGLPSLMEQGQLEM